MNPTLRPVSQPTGFPRLPFLRGRGFVSHAGMSGYLSTDGLLPSSSNAASVEAGVRVASQVHKVRVRHSPSGSGRRANAKSLPALRQAPMIRLRFEVVATITPQENSYAAMEIAIDDEGNLLLPSGPKVDCVLNDASIAALPANLIVGGSLYLTGTAITSFPGDVSVGGSIYLGGTPISSLPNNLSIGGNLWLGDTPIGSLPEKGAERGAFSLQTAEY